MSRKRHSVPNFWGGFDHYDENGKKIGSSVPDAFDGFIEYDAKGRKSGYSVRDVWGGYTHYDSNGKKTGFSQPDLFDTGFNHYDSRGKKTGSSYRTMLGDYKNTGSSTPKGFSGGSVQGCYIATCVYGSYDCSPVWTLRRFRDEYLATRVWGTAFIRLYYRVSPKLVAKFGESKLFRMGWKAVLDNFVALLQRKGYTDTPYRDF